MAPKDSNPLPSKKSARRFVYVPAPLFEELTEALDDYTNAHKKFDNRPRWRRLPGVPTGMSKLNRAALRLDTAARDISDAATNNPPTEARYIRLTEEQLDRLQSLFVKNGKPLLPPSENELRTANAQIAAGHAVSGAGAVAGNSSWAVIFIPTTGVPVIDIPVEFVKSYWWVALVGGGSVVEAGNRISGRGTQRIDRTIKRSANSKRVAQQARILTAEVTAASRGTVLSRSDELKEISTSVGLTALQPVLDSDKNSLQSLDRLIEEVLSEHQQQNWSEIIDNGIGRQSAADSIRQDHLQSADSRPVTQLMNIYATQGVIQRVEDVAKVESHRAVETLQIAAFNRGLTHLGLAEMIDPNGAQGPVRSALTSNRTQPTDLRLLRALGVRALLIDVAQSNPPLLLAETQAMNVAGRSHFLREVILDAVNAGLSALGQKPWTQESKQFQNFVPPALYGSAVDFDRLPPITGRTDGFDSLR